MKNFLVLFILFSLSLSASVVHISQLPPDLQKTVIPDMEGRVLINDLDSQLTKYSNLERELPSVVAGWPVSYSGSNCKNGAIYVNMDADPEDEILFGVGTKITALNLDGTTVPGWPVQLGYYIWSSPAVGDIDGDGDMEIICTSRNNTTGNEGALYAFELDGTPCSGFPVMQAGGGTNNASLFDLDNDGDLEILVNVRNHPQGWVYVFDGDGTIYPNFPQELDYIPGAGISAGDVTGDGIPEIIALSYYKLHVYDLSGNLLPGFPLENTGYNYSYSQPILYDLDGDDLNEIIWGGCDSDTGAVFAVNSDASSVPGWPQTTDYWIFGTVSIGDIDQDGNLDVIVGDQVSSGTPSNHIFAWDAAGNAIAGFPAGPTNAIYAQIGIADLDGDNYPELMIDDNNFGYGYDAYNHDGTHCTDWPLPCGTVWSSTTMQITPVFGDVDNDGEIEIMGAATDIMNWVVECYLWDTGEVWNEDLAYMIIDGVNMQHNGLYSESTTPPPVFDPPENVQVIDWSGLITWEPPTTNLNSEDLDGYNVYLDGVFQDFTTELEYQLDPAFLVLGETYIAGVSAVYSDPLGESDCIEVEFTFNFGPIDFDPPNNPAAVVEDYNDVLVTWELPGPTNEYIQHHSGYDNNGIGTGAAVDFICAARFDDVELNNYYGDYEISGVNIFLHSMDFSYVGIQVYEGGSYGDPGTLVYEEDITSSAVAEAWTNHLLSTPVPLVAGNEYWLAYDISATGDHPAAVDMGPMVPDKGAWMYFSGAWQTLPELGASLDYNWVITGALTESTDSSGKNTALIGRQHTIGNSAQFEAEYTATYRRQNSSVVNSNLRALSGYTIYRDGTEIADITDPAILQYLDESLDAGTYEYTIEAYYTNPDGVSDPTDPVSATVVLAAPIDVEANSLPPNILLTWAAPERGIDSYNVYRDDILIAENITGLMFIDPDISSYHYWNITAVYDGGWESVFSETVGLGSATDPNLVSLVTDLNNNYPNPFNPETTISFTITEGTTGTLSIYTIKGQLIESHKFSAGKHDFIWNAAEQSSGIYFYKLKSGNYSKTGKMLLLK